MRRYAPQIPQIGKKYYVYDDGKHRLSREDEIEITKIISFKDLDKNLVRLWEEEVNTYSLYSKTTDYLVFGVLNNGDKAVFTRSYDGKWFSIQLEHGYVDPGEIDISGVIHDVLIESKESGPIDKLIGVRKSDVLI